MPKRSAKKSESLEVRISYEAKRAIARKASSEGRTVSSVIRELIDGYIGNSQTESLPSSREGKLVWFYKLARTPKIVLTSALIALSTSLLLIPSASAEDIQLSIKGEILHTDQTDTKSTSTKSIETTVIVSAGDTIEFDLGNKNKSSNAKHLVMRISLSEATLQDSTKGVLISLELVDTSDGNETIVAKPQLTVPLGQTAQFVSGVEGVEMYDFEFIPTKS